MGHNSVLQGDVAHVLEAPKFKVVIVNAEEGTEGGMMACNQQLVARHIR